MENATKQPIAPSEIHRDGPSVGRKAGHENILEPVDK